MFENTNNLFIAFNAEGDLAVWRECEGYPHGPVELATKHGTNPMVWDVLSSVLPYYFECEVCGLVNADEHNDAACRNSQDNYVNGFNN